jgi:hypothetical protein
MVNDFSKIPGDSELRDTARIEPDETPLGEYYGSGSGTDDLADYNANEASDYCSE